MSRALIRLYGFDECPYCAKAIDLLLFEDVELEIVKLPTLDERKAWMDERGYEKPNRTFPRVFQVVEGMETLIGGYDDLVELFGQRQAA